MSIAAFMREGHSTQAESIFGGAARDGAVVPGLWPLEVGDVLLILERRGLSAALDASRSIGGFAALPIKIDPETAELS